MTIYHRTPFRDDPEFIGLVKLARRLRQRQTPAEKMMWELLRGRRFLGLKFRRQYRIERFYVDFGCPEQRLVIELDGEVHETPEQAASDENRDDYLRQTRHTVLRFTNQQVFDETEWVLEEIARNCKGINRTFGKGETGA